MLPNAGVPAAVSSVQMSILLYAPCFQGYFLVSLVGLQSFVFADPEAGFENFEHCMQVFKHCIRIIQHYSSPLIDIHKYRNNARCHDGHSMSDSDVSNTASMQLPVEQQASRLILAGSLF